VAFLASRSGFFLGIATTAAISLFLASYVVARNLKKKPIAGIEGMIGHEAKIIEWSDHSGRVQVQGELWAATSLHPQNFSVGETVIVGGIKDLSLHIHKKP
jgi:membrane protein implicated in regulation of membrane protease activity